MIRRDIPVILLKNLVLLPNNTLKLEFDNRTNENNVIVAIDAPDNGTYILVNIWKWFAPSITAASSKALGNCI